MTNPAPEFQEPFLDPAKVDFGVASQVTTSIFLLGPMDNFQSTCPISGQIGFFFEDPSSGDAC